MTVDTTDYELADRAAAQAQAHAADPLHVAKYVPADEPGLETEAWTAAGPEEPN